MRWDGQGGEVLIAMPLSRGTMLRSVGRVAGTLTLLCALGCAATSGRPQAGGSGSRTATQASARRATRAHRIARINARGALGMGVTLVVLGSGSWVLGTYGLLGEFMTGGCAAEQDDRACHYAAIAILYGIAATLVAGGVLLIAYGHARTDELDGEVDEASRARLELLPGPAGAALRLTF